LAEYYVNRQLGRLKKFRRKINGLVMKSLNDITRTSVKSGQMRARLSQSFKPTSDLRFILPVTTVMETRSTETISGGK
jgi:hypothetical protein